MRGVMAWLTWVTCSSNAPNTSEPVDGYLQSHGLISRSFSCFDIPVAQMEMADFKDNFLTKKAKHSVSGPFGIACFDRSCSCSFKMRALDQAKA